MNPDGSGLTNLTNDPLDEDWPAWSPDGKKIAFTSIRSPSDGYWEIYVMNADGSNQTRVTNNPARDFGPAWSPDGTRIAFHSDRDHTKFDSNNEIYLVDADGSNPLRLTNDPFVDNFPAWSPDGSKIAFGSQQGGVAGIFVMNPDGSNQTRLTGNPLFGDYPDWSPDGTKIVFSNGDIHVMDANGANPINLTNTPGEDLDPSWQRKPTSTPVPAQALNLSTRLRVLGDDGFGIGGFIITANPSARNAGPTGASKTVAIRGIGPSLDQFAIPGFLADPVLQLYSSQGLILQQNDNWQDDPEQAAQLTALGLAPQSPEESGMVASLSPGAYTAILSGKNGGTGVGLVEIYDTDPNGGSQLANVSTRGVVGTGSDVMIGGFILGGGSDNTQIAVRGKGPSIGVLPIPPELNNPVLELRDSNGALLIANDDWQSDPAMAAQLSAHGLALSNPRESGIFVSLPPGLFTAILSGTPVTFGTGTAVIELYNLGAP